MDRSQHIKGVGRLEAFSDGVMAIIITLLIFEVRVPALAAQSTPAVLHALLGIAPKIVSFTISFFTVAIFWVNHHHMFAIVAHTNWKLLWYNLLILTAVVPFTTALSNVIPFCRGLALCPDTVPGSYINRFHYVFFRSDRALASLSRNREFASYQSRVRRWI